MIARYSSLGWILLLANQNARVKEKPADGSGMDSWTIKVRARLMNPVLDVELVWGLIGHGRSCQTPLRLQSGSKRLRFDREGDFPEWLSKA